MNLNKPEDDIDFEIKKMKFVDFLVENIVSADFLVEEFGFEFVKTFVMGLTNIPENHSAYHISNKAQIILNGLYELKPIDEYPERWI